LSVPDFEIRDASFAYDDAVGGGNGEGESKFANRPNRDFFDGAMGDNILAVGTEEERGVELLHDEVEGFINGMLLSAQKDGAGEFVLDIETGYLTDFDGDEFVEHWNEKVGAVMLERRGESRHGHRRRGCGEAVEFVEGAEKVVLANGFEEVIYAVDFEGLESVLVVGCGKDDGAGNFNLVEDMEGEAVGKVDVHEAEVGIWSGGGGVELFEIFDALFDALYDGKDVELGRYLGKGALEMLRGYYFVFDNEDVFHGGVRLRECRR
jgi:hypothetical protein